MSESSIDPSVSTTIILAGLSPTPSTPDRPPSATLIISSKTRTPVSRTGAPYHRSKMAINHSA